MKFCAQQAQIRVHLRDLCALKKRISQTSIPIFLWNDFRLLTKRIKVQGEVCSS